MQEASLHYDRCQKLNIRLGCRDEKQASRAKLGWKIERGKGEKKKAVYRKEKTYIRNFHECNLTENNFHFVAVFESRVSYLSSLASLGREFCCVFYLATALLKIRRLILKKKEKERMSSRSKAEPIVNDDEACFDTIRAS